MKLIKNIISNEKGISMIESVLITAVIATIIYVVGPSIKQAFFGVPGNPGIGVSIVEKQTAGLDESSKNVKVLNGCQLVGNITSDKCSELENSK